MGIPGPIAKVKTWLVANTFHRSLCRSGSMRRTIYVAVAIWIISLLLAAPDLVGSHVATRPSGMPYCSAYRWGEWYEQFRTMFRFVVLFACPMIVITVFYSVIAFTLLCRSRDAVDVSSGGEAASRQLDSRRKVSSLSVKSFTASVRVVKIARGSGSPKARRRVSYGLWRELLHTFSTPGRKSASRILVVFFKIISASKGWGDIRQGG